MGFLDRAKAPAGEVKDKPEVKPNPLAASKPNPLAGKTNPLAAKKNPLAGGASNPLAAKKNVFAKPEEKVEVKSEAKEAVEEAVKEVKAKVEPVNEEKIEAKEETKVEVKTEVPEKAAEGDKVEETKEIVQETVQEEEKKNTSKKTTSRKAPVAKKEETSEEMEVVSIDIPTTEISFNDAVSKITSHFVDEEWDAFQATSNEAVSSIVINDDMNAATLKKVGADLDKLRSQVWLMYSNVKALYDELSSEKPEGLIERTKRISFTDKQKNDMDRRKAGIQACMKYKDNVNLFEVMDETRKRFYFLKELISQIDFKAGVLITMSSAIKKEN